jgi:hypothetical protein
VEDFEAEDPKAEAVSHESESAPVASGSWWTDAGADQPETPWGSDPWKAQTPAEEAVVETSPWGTPITGAEDETSDDGADEKAAEPAASDVSTADAEESGWVSPQESDDRTGGWWSETMGGAEQEDPDNEADRFLESVFSSLSDDESAKPEKDDDAGFGMGLLRRRRLGAAARDIDSDR